MNNLEAVYREGRLIRDDWSREEDGRQFLCLLTALADDPDVRPETCPASLCPEWVAHLLPWIDDAGTADRWPGHIERLIPLAGRLHLLGRRAERHVKRAAVATAQPYDTSGSCEGVLALLDRALAGDEPTEGEWAASAASADAAWAAADAAWAAADAAYVAVAWAAAKAAVRAAWAAADAADAATATAVSAAAATAARAAARAAAADDLIGQIITIWEEELAC